MKTIPPSVSFFLRLANTQSKLLNRFDRALGGLGFTEFLILLSLDQAPDGQLSRIELAEKIGMTASGVTRILLPMAKIGLIKSGPPSSDARVRAVRASASGREKMGHELTRLEFLTDELLANSKKKDLETLTELLRDLDGRVSAR